MLVSETFACEVFAAAYRSRMQHRSKGEAGRGYGYIEFAHYCIAMRIIAESLDPSVASVLFPNQVRDDAYNRTSDDAYNRSSAQSSSRPLRSIGDFCESGAVGRTPSAHVYTLCLCRPSHSVLLISPYP